MESQVSSQNSTAKSTASSPSSLPRPSFVSRLWKPAAQRNLRNQWSKLSSLRHEWGSSSSAARSHATSLVNAYLSQRYMKNIELGVLSDMRDIRKKACWKLLKQQGIHRSKLLSSYKDMVTIIANMVNAGTSMRCFLKGGANSPLVQYSSISDNTNDNGDGGGMPVFIFWSITSFEKLARELVQMFAMELNLKRLLVLEFLSIRSEEHPQVKKLCWSDELYHGEFDVLSRCSLDLREACEVGPPKLENWKCDTPMQSNCQPDSDVLQVYITAWIAVVNINKDRLEDIFSEVGEEMHVNFL